MFTGLDIGICELGLFGLISVITKLTYKQLRLIDNLAYYWTLMTILTGIWEISFISKYKYTNKLSSEFINNNTHVWTEHYDITYILPWKLAHIFYAEYGAYADREYMTIRDDWSRLIEGTHAIFCGLFAFLAIVYKLRNMSYSYKISLGIAMGTQLMNSLLYMGNYFIQCNSPTSVNYDRSDFPSGKFLEKRPFMYVNLFWTIMPCLVIIDLLCFTKQPFRYLTKLGAVRKNYLSRFLFNKKSTSNKYLDEESVETECLLEPNNDTIDNDTIDNDKSNITEKIHTSNNDDSIQITKV